MVLSVCSHLVVSSSCPFFDLLIVSLLAFPVWKREEWEEGVACPAPRNGTSLGLNPSTRLAGGPALRSTVSMG